MMGWDLGAAVSRPLGIVGGARRAPGATETAPPVFGRPRIVGATAFFSKASTTRSAFVRRQHARGETRVVFSDEGLGLCSTATPTPKNIRAVEIFFPDQPGMFFAGRSLTRKSTAFCCARRIPWHPRITKEKKKADRFSRPLPSGSKKKGRHPRPLSWRRWRDLSFNTSKYRPPPRPEGCRSTRKLAMAWRTSGPLRSTQDIGPSALGPAPYEAYAREGTGTHPTFTSAGLKTHPGKTP